MIYHNGHYLLWFCEWLTRLMLGGNYLLRKRIPEGMRCMSKSAHNMIVRLLWLLSWLLDLKPYALTHAHAHKMIIPLLKAFLMSHSGKRNVLGALSLKCLDLCLWISSIGRLNVDRQYRREGDSNLGNQLNTDNAILWLVCSVGCLWIGIGIVFDNLIWNCTFPLRGILQYSPLIT